MILYGLNFCECFCGNVCVNRYVNHHWGKGRQLPEETKKKQSLARLGKEPWNKGKTEVYKEETLEKIREARAKQVFSEESNRKRSESMKGRPCSNKGYKHTEEWKEENSKRMKQFWEDGVFTPHEAWNKGLHTEGHLHTEEAKRKMSELAKGKPKTEEHKRHLSEANLGKKHTEEHKRKISEGNKGRVSGMRGKHHTEEAKEKISEGVTKTLSNLEVREKISKIVKNIWDSYTEEEKVNRTRNGVIALKQSWIDLSENERNARIKKILLSANRRPNKPETIILNLLDELYPNEWKYVGDGQVVIGSKNPDFINVNGQKKIIELFGDYYHRGQDSHDRINIFKPYGYETLVIWEKELENIDLVISKINNFVE